MTTEELEVAMKAIDDIEAAFLAIRSTTLDRWDVNSIYVRAACNNFAAISVLRAAIKQSKQPGIFWRPIFEAPPHTHVLVAGCQTGEIASDSWWWWHEDITDEKGRPIDRPQASHFAIISVETLLEPAK